MAIVVSEKNKREMSTERDFPGPVEVRQRYCILSSPRSGSTLLGRMLYETGAAGDPQEYFNPPLLIHERQRSGDEKLAVGEFIRRMQARRTSPNGVFGMKMHYSQMLGAFGAKAPTNDMLGHLKRYQQLIWIRRRDRLRQAISQALGQKTGVWSSEESRGSPVAEVKLQPYECVRALQMVCGDDFGWQRLIQSTGIKVHEVWYEDLVSDYDNQCRQVLKYLQIDDAVPTIPKPPLQRQATELNERLHAQLCQYLGVTETAS